MNLSDLTERCRDPGRRRSTPPTTTCARTAAGLARCWGHGLYGKSSVPADLGPISWLSAGWQHTCAIKITGKVSCWGRQITGVTKSVPPSIH